MTPKSYPRATSTALGLVALLAACSDDATPAATESDSSTTLETGTDSEGPDPSTGPDITGTTLDPTTGPGPTTGPDPTDTTGPDPTETTGPDPTAGVDDCTDLPDLCGPGTVCDPDTRTCVADCSADLDACGPGTICVEGVCKADCAGDGVCGAGTVCGGEGFCVADCRKNLLDVCGGQGLCQASTGLCEPVVAIDCNQVSGLCWGDQECDPSGYCRAAVIDAELEYDVQHYDLKLDLRTAEKGFDAEVKIFFVATQDGTAAITLDIGQPVIKNGEEIPAYEIVEVTDAAGAPLMAAPSGAALTVTLPAPLAEGEGFVVRVQYTGVFNPADPSDPLYYTGLMERYGKHDNVYFQTFGWPVYTQRWLPSHDRVYDVATFSADVGIDADLTVLANGLPVAGGEVDGLARTTFLLQQPVPPYALHVVASELEQVRLGVVEGVAIDGYTHPNDAPAMLAQFGSLTSALTYYNDVLGAYPFGRLAMVAVPTAFGGMEHATVASVADTLVTVDTGRRAAIHEMLHHWFGDNAYQGEMQAFWLNEAWAEFLTWEALRVLAGQPAYRDRLDARRASVFKNPGVYNDDALHYQVAQGFPGAVTQASFSAPYDKGAWVLHMLRTELGDAAFFQFARDFYEEHRFARYYTVSMLDVLEATVGGDFSGFFDEWVYGKGWPQVKTTWSYDAATEKIAVEAEQVQDAAFGVYTLAGKRALAYSFDDGDAATPACTGTLSFTGGATSAALEIDCPAAPTGFTIPSAADIFVELVQ